MKQAACGGTGCAVLNGETLLQSHWAALGGLQRKRSVSIGLTGSRPWPEEGNVARGGDLVRLSSANRGCGDILDRKIIAVIYK